MGKFEESDSHIPVINISALVCVTGERHDVFPELRGEAL
jgi:hypothetical protein